MHIHHIALPRPGNWRTLRKVANQIFSEPLDQSRPLWSFTFVEGLDNIPQVPQGVRGSDIQDTSRGSRRRRQYEHFESALRFHVGNQGNSGTEALPTKAVAKRIGGHAQKHLEFCGKAAQISKADHRGSHGFLQNRCAHPGAEGRITYGAIHRAAQPLERHHLGPAQMEYGNLVPGPGKGPEGHYENDTERHRTSHLRRSPAPIPARKRKTPDQTAGGDGTHLDQDRSGGKRTRQSNLFHVSATGHQH